MERDIKIQIVENKSGVWLRVKSFKRQFVEISIYDIEKNKIKTLFQGEMERNRYNFFWDRRDENKIPVKSGVYLVGVKREGELRINFESLIFII